MLTGARIERGGRAGGPAAKTGGESRRRSVTGRCGGVAEVVAEGSGSGKLLAVTAESKRCVDGAPVRRSGVATYSRRRRALGGGGEGGCDVLGLGGGCWMGWGAGEGHGHLRRVRGSWERVSVVITAVIAAGLARAGKTDLGAVLRDSGLKWSF
jgi:hypothetical protein